MFTSYEVRIPREYSGSWGKTPPVYKALSDKDATLQRVNDAIKAVMGADFEPGNPLAANLFVYWEQGAPPECITEISLRGILDETSEEEIHSIECQLTDILVNMGGDIEEDGIENCRPLAESSEALTTDNGVRFYPQKKVTPGALNGGAYAVAIVSTENYKVTTAILGAVISAIVEGIPHETYKQ